MKFIPTIDVESLPVFNSVDKSRWTETACPKCGVRYRIARLSKNSFDVCIILAEKLRPRPEDAIVELVTTD